MEKKKNTPKLRFPEFTGEWEEKKLGHFFKDLKTGMTPYRGNLDYFKGRIPWITSGELCYNIILKTNEYITEQAIKDTNLKIYEPNTLFIAITGLEAPGTRGKCALNGIPAATNQSCMAFEAHPNINTRFLFYWYNKYGTFLYYKYAQGTKQQSFNNAIVENFDFIYSTLAEQTKIATFLTAVDEKLTQLKKKKTLLEQYKKGVMQKLFSQELRFKDDNNQDFPDWQEKTLGEVSQVKDGTHESPQYYECGFPFITSKNLMTDGNIDLENVSYINEDDFRRFNIRSKVEVNDILFAMIGTIGNPVLVRNDGFAIKNIALIKEKHNLLNIFLIHYMKGPSIKQQFFEQNTGGTQKFLSLGIIKKLIIDIPSLPEQVKIATFLSAIDEKISHSSAQIEKMEAWKKGLLQQMFC